MKILRYIFWRFWKFRVRKENNEDSAYVFVTLFLGLFILGLPLLIILKTFDLELPLLPKNKLIQYCMAIPIVLLLSFPLRFLFPKKIIFHLKYTDLEIKNNNRTILIALLLVILIVMIKLLVLNRT